MSSFIEKVLAHQPASTMQRQVARARGQSEASEVHEFGRQVERRYVPSAFGVASQAVEQRSAPGQHLGGSRSARLAPGRLATLLLE